MKRLFSALIIIAGFGISASAQIKKPGFTLGANIFYANPQDESKSAYKGGVGGEVKGGFGIRKTYIVASVGYTGFLAESENGAGTFTYMPIKVGVKQYFLARRLFINADAGVASLKNTKMAIAEKRLAGDLGFGARLLGLEAGIYYDIWRNAEGLSGTTRALLFKLGYNFTL